jgi:hypothetical protein
LELIKDYDLGINYHPGKANVVAEALSRRSHASHLVVKSIPSELCDRFAKLKIVANVHDLKATYWWYGMKRDIAEYVAHCDTCQQVKAKHQ